MCDHIIKRGLAHIKRHAITKKHITRARVVVGVEPIAKHGKNKIEWKIVMYAVEHNVSFKSIGHLTKLIKEVALHPNSVALIKCSQKKAKHIVVNRFGPQQLAALSAQLRKVNVFIIIEETTDCSASKSVAMTVRFRDSNSIKRFFLDSWNALKRLLRSC